MTTPLPPGFGVGTAPPGVNVGVQPNAPTATQPAGIDFAAIAARDDARLAAERAEQIEETTGRAVKHGRGETFGTQLARGALDALLSPGALIGLAARTQGAAVSYIPGFERAGKLMQDFGRDVGRASTGKSALEVGAALSEVFGSVDEQANAATAMVKRVQEQEEDWPLLSGVSQAAGSVAFGLATGLGAAGLAKNAPGAIGRAFLGEANAGANIGARGLIALGAAEGTAAGSQAAYDANSAAPLEDVWTSAAIGGLMGGAFTGGIVGAAKLAPKVAAGVKKAFAGSIEDSLGEFAEKRAAKMIGFRAKHGRRLGPEEISRISADVLATRLDDGTPVIPEGIIDAAKLDQEELAERLLLAREQAGSKLGAFRQRASDFIDQASPDLRPSPAELASRIEVEVVNPLRESISPAAAGHARQAQKVADNLRALGDDVSLEALTQRRIELDPDIRWDAKAPDVMRRVRGIIEGDIEARMGLAAERMGEAGEYLPLKRQYRSMAESTKVAAEAQGEEFHRFLSLSDNLVGIGGLAGDMATGGGMSALKGFGMAVGHKVLRERSSAVLATLTRRYARTAVELREGVIAGREAREALTEIVRAKNFIRETGEALENPNVRAVGENTAREAADAEIAKRAGEFDPAKWAEGNRAPSPLARMVYRQPILDQVSQDLAAAVPRTQALRPGLDFDIDPKAAARLVKDADGAAAIGDLQARVRDIVEATTDDAAVLRAQLMRRPVEYDSTPLGAEPHMAEVVDVGAVNRIGLRNADFNRDPGSYRMESMPAIRSADPEALPPVRVDIWPDGQISLGDGRHRLLAAEERGAAEINALVQQRNNDGEVFAKYVGPVSVGPRADAMGPAAAVLRELETADAAKAFAVAHRLARELPPEQSRALQLALTDDHWGQAGRFYRELVRGPDEKIAALADPANMREALRTLELRGQLSGRVNEEHRASLAAHKARAKLSGEAASPDIAKQARDLEALWARAEESVTLDGGRLSRVLDALETLDGGEVKSRVPSVGKDDQVYEAIREAIAKVAPIVKPGIRRAAPRSAASAAHAPASMAERLRLYEKKLDQVAQMAIEPDQEAHAQALNAAPEELRDRVASGVAQRMQQLLADLPKLSTEFGGKVGALSSNDLRRGEAMIEATTEPLSVFDDLANGYCDPDKAAYAWIQWPGLQAAAQAGILDLLNSQLSDEERTALPAAVLTQLDYTLGFGGGLSATVKLDFSQRFSALGETARQQQSAQAPPRRQLNLPTSKPSFTQRLAGARQ